MSFVMQSVSLLHFVPMITWTVLLAVACLLVPHTTSIVCEPLVRVVAVVNLNGAAESDASGLPSTAKSTSWMPSPDVQFAWTVKPGCSALPSAGVTVSDGACAPAGPNTFVMIWTSFCVAWPELMHWWFCPLHGRPKGD